MSISKVKLLELSVRKRLTSDFLWSYKTSFRGSGLIFSDLREYVYWDSVKNIDWKTSAKYNDIYIKNYEEERDLKVFFLIDLTSSMKFWSEKKTKIDLLIEIFFILTFSAINNQDKIGILLYNWDSTEFIDFKSWEENIFIALRKIDKLLKKSVNKVDINTEIFKKVEAMGIRSTLTFVLSDKMELNTKLSRLLGVENELIYINIFDFFENNLADENISLTLWLENRFLNLFLWDKSKINKYKDLRKQKIKDFKWKLKNNNIDYIILDTKTDIFRELMLFFKKRINLVNVQNLWRV